MSSGPKTVTQTTNNEPPQFLRGPLTTAVNAAQSQFVNQSGHPAASFGTGARPSGRGLLGGSYGRLMNERDPFIPGQNTGSTVTPGQGTANDLIGQSQGLISDTLAGGFLNSNPYLDQTFNRAADLTRTRLSSEFAGAGRDLGAALPARSDELQTLASNIYGQNYQAERDRQINAIDQSQGLDPLNMFINRLAGIIPGAGGSTTSTQPVFRTGIFSDRRLKKDIECIGQKAGLPWYSFTYVWGQKSEGFMSDEVPQEHVIKHESGYDMVDYDAILGDA